MIKVIFLLFVCWGLASLTPQTADKWKLNIRSKEMIRKVALIALILVMVCFSGLRTRMNDTATYFHTYQNLPTSVWSVDYFSMSLGDNPGFVFYQLFLRSLGFCHASEFIFITSIFVTTSYILFLRKYSSDFPYTIFLFITMLVYAFTMGAMKQTIAISIGIWSIDAILNKKKIRFVLIILFASLFHPYILIFFAMPLFMKELWSKQMVLCAILTVAAGGAFGTVVEGFMSIASSIGNDYDASTFDDGGVNIFRLLIYLVIPVMSFIFRKQLKENAPGEVNFFINLSIISSCFMVLASFGGASLFGRMAGYFDIFNCLSLPFILTYGLNKNETRLIKPLSMIFFTLYYITYYSKYGTAWDSNYYNHISLFDLFEIMMGE